MKALEEFDVTVTFCFTPEHRGIAPHHTSPPLVIEEFADFCARMTRRYAPNESACAQQMSEQAVTNFLFIRHGRHDYLGRAIAGRKAGVHLNDDGRKEAEHLPEKLSLLPIDAIYSSPMERVRRNGGTDRAPLQSATADRGVSSPRSASASGKTARLTSYRSSRSGERSMRSAAAPHFRMAS